MTKRILLSLILWGGVVFNTLNAQKTLPYSYGFEFTGTYNATNAANALTTEGWTTTNASSSTMIKQYMYNNGKSFCFYVDESKDYQYLVSPLLSNASSLNVGFLWKTTTSTTVKFQIGYSKSDTPDVATNFTWSDPVTATYFTTYTLASQSFSTDGIKYIAIKFDRNSETATRYIAIDEVTISIVPPKNLVASPMTSLATLSWTKGYNESNWLVYYSSTNTAPTDYTTNVSHVEANPNYTITGLTKDETYYAWVCAESNGIYSAWVGPVEFTPSDEFTLTVYNGTAGQAGAPFHYNTTNSGVKSQFIIPSTELTYLINKQITDLQFYHSVANQSWGDAKFEIYMKEFDSKTTFDSDDDYTDWSTMTKVYDGNATFSTDGNKIMAIELTNPYIYEGGNLMIGFKIIATGSAPSYCTWYGVSQSTANNTCIFYTTYRSGVKWLPKITFTSQYITFDNCNWGTGATTTAAQNVELKNDVTVANGTNAIASIIEMASGSSLTIENGATLTCNNIIGATAANLIIEDGGQLAVNSSGVQATFQKGIHGYTSTKDSYYLIANPTTTVINPTEVEGMLSNEYDLFYFDESQEGEEWRNYKQETFNLVNGKGYLYANSEDILEPLEFKGTVPTGTSSSVTLNLKGTGTYKGFNLVGNPMSVNITSMNIGGSDCSYYKLNPTTGVFAVSTDPIIVGEAFMVQTESDGATLSLNPAAKGESDFNNDVIRLEVSNNKYTDVAYLYFGNHLPLTKINHLNDEAPMLYFHNEKADRAVSVMNDRSEVKSVNVNFEAKTTGKYTLSSNTKGEFSYLHVIDRLTGEDVDMLLEDEYEFMASKNDNANRFIVKLEYSENAENSDNSIFAYQNGSDIVVTGEGELQIFDVMGRMVSTQNVNGRETVNVSAQGVYIFRLNGMTQKIVVR